MGDAAGMFTRISEALIRRRAEHNDGMLSTLEEVALHQQNIGHIELLGRLCPKLKIVYLQNNLISRIQNLHKLKELEYLNLAVNNVTHIQNLQRCESLTKLDLTINFVGQAGLITVPSLAVNLHLKELILMGNPCTEWSGYRPYVLAKLPQLKKLDGVDIKPSERIAALQQLPDLEAHLRAELTQQGIDPDRAAEVEDDSLFDEEGQVQETGTVDEATGELRRPWCPATRMLDHMENERANRDADTRKKAATSDGPGVDGPRRPTRHTDFPEIKEDERVMQRNDGKWDFSMEESDDKQSIVFEVDVGRYLDTSLIKTDLQPTYIRLLIKGKLLQLLLPCEVITSRSSALRSQATGRLKIEMAKLAPSVEANVALIRPKKSGSQDAGHLKELHTKTAHAPTPGSRPVARGPDTFVIKEARKAVVQAADLDADEDYIPPL